MFMIVIIYFTNVFQDNHIFLFRYFHNNFAMLKTMIKTLTNRDSFSKVITHFKSYLIKTSLFPHKK